MDDLDTQWLDEVNAMEHSMDIFYKQCVQEIKLTFFYIQKDEIIHTKRTTVHLSNACFYKESLSKYIRDNRFFNEKAYQVYQVIKYNYTITPQQLLDMEHYNTTIEVIHPLRDITFQDTIPFFKELNELIFLMVPKKQNEQFTKKVRFHKRVSSVSRKHMP